MSSYEVLPLTPWLSSANITCARGKGRDLFAILPNLVQFRFARTGFWWDPRGLVMRCVASVRWQAMEALFQIIGSSLVLVSNNIL